MAQAQDSPECSRKERDAELRRLLDSCPDEVLLLLLQLVQEREKMCSPSSRRNGERPEDSGSRSL